MTSKKRNALLLLAMGLVLMAGPVRAQFPDPNQSSACLVTCPGGDAVARVEVRDQLGQPMPGVLVILAIFGPVGTIQPCIQIPVPPAVQADFNGVAEFRLPWGGATPFGAQVLVDFGQGPAPLYPNLPIAGFDLDGDGVVSPADLNEFNLRFGTNAPEADYDCDGIVEVSDLLAFQGHEGHSCKGVLAESFQVPGNETFVIANADSFSMNWTFADQTIADVGLDWTDIVFKVGPRVSPTEVEMRLTNLSAGSDEGADTLPTGELTMYLHEDDTQVAGVWDDTGSFSVGPVRWVIQSELADSLLGGPPDSPADTTDIVVSPADTVSCTLSGQMTYDFADGSYDITGSLTFGQQPASQYISIVDGDTPQPFLIDNRASSNVKPAKCVRLCKQICLIPIVVCDTLGSQIVNPGEFGVNCGISVADLAAMKTQAANTWAGCCIRMSFASTVVVGKTLINTWPSGSASRSNKMTALWNEVQKTDDWKNYEAGPLKVPKSQCVKVMFVKGGDGPDGGGLAEKPGELVVINKTKLDDTCKPPRPVAGPRVLAHELGHTVGLEDHPGAPQTCMNQCAPVGGAGGTKAVGAMEFPPDASECGRAYNGDKGKLRVVNKCCYEEKKDIRGIVKVK